MQLKRCLVKKYISACLVGYGIYIYAENLHEQNARKKPGQFETEEE